jgi:hypothetical protein
MEETISFVTEKTDETRSRFQDAPWANESFRITIGGVGSIGSWLLLALSRTCQHSLTIYDDDFIDATNMAGQMYRLKDIGQLKTKSAVDLVSEMTNRVFITSLGRFTGQEDLDTFDSVCFACFDNIDTRKVMYDRWKAKAEKVKADGKSDLLKYCLFVDGRLTAENYQVYFIPYTSKKAMAQYEKELFSHAEAAIVPCSFKSTSHFAMMIAARMVQGFTNWVAAVKGSEYELPFKISENGSLFDIEITNL